MALDFKVDRLEGCTDFALANKRTFNVDLVLVVVEGLDVDVDGARGGVQRSSTSKPSDLESFAGFLGIEVQLFNKPSRNKGLMSECPELPGL